MINGTNKLDLNHAVGGRVDPIVIPRLLHGDCMKLMFDIPDNSIDMVCCDMPYGTTACKWDAVLPLDMMWAHYERILKDNGVVVLFSSQPFTFSLANSNSKLFKYGWVWEKNFSTNFFHAKRQPLRKHEDILVFYKKSGKYYPIKTTGHQPTQSAKGRSKGKLWHGDNNRDYKGGDTDRYPTSILKINAVDPKKRQHPTQKPVALIEYLIKTYTNEGDTVLDNCMGSGTTGVACKNLNRNFVGIELDEDYFKIAQKRIAV